MSSRRYGKPLRSSLWYWLLIGWWWEFYVLLGKLLFRPRPRRKRR